MVGHLTMLWKAMSSTVRSMLGCSPNDAFWMEVVDELVAEFWE
jgi:hypothetical protein